MNVIAIVKVVAACWTKLIGIAIFYFSLLDVENNPQVYRTMKPFNGQFGKRLHLDNGS